MEGLSILILLCGLVALSILSALDRAGQRRRSAYRERSHGSQLRRYGRGFGNQRIAPAAGIREIGWLLIALLLLLSLVFIGATQAELREQRGGGIGVEQEYAPNGEPARMTFAVGEGWGAAPAEPRAVERS